MISHSIRKLHIGKRRQMELNGTLYSKVLSHPTEPLTSGGKVKSGIQWKQLSARSRKVTEWDQRMLRHIVHRSPTYCNVRCSPEGPITRLHPAIRWKSLGLVDARGTGLV